MIPVRMNYLLLEFFTYNARKRVFSVLFHLLNVSEYYIVSHVYHYYYYYTYIHATKYRMAKRYCIIVSKITQQNQRQYYIVSPQNRNCVCSFYTLH